jgi:hypothetical protein
MMHRNLAAWITVFSAFISVVWRCVLHLTWELPSESMGAVPISSWLRNLKWLASQRLLPLYLSSLK